MLSPGLANIRPVSTDSRGDLFSDWLYSAVSTTTLPRLLVNSAFYTQSDILEATTLRLNSKSVSSVLDGLDNTLAQTLAFTHLTLSPTQLAEFSANVKRETLTQVLNYLSTYAQVLSSARLQRLFNQLPAGTLDAGNLRFGELQGLCFQAGQEAMLAALEFVDVDTLVKAMSLRAVWLHYLPTLRRPNGVLLPYPTAVMGGDALHTLRVETINTDYLRESFNNYVTSCGG